MEELIIVGGGVAGLSCLNALLDNHVSPLLLEASTIGTPKMCGEFLAPPVMEPLQKWGVGPVETIRTAQFLGLNRSVHVSFPRTAGAYARENAELELAARAKKMGARILEQSPIKEIIPATPDSPFMLHLSSGEILLAKDVIFATGKFSQQANASKYVGFKTHIPQVIQPETLLMFGFLGGYLGIVPVTPDKSNLTCLVKRELVEAAGSCREYLDLKWKQLSSLHVLPSHCDVSASTLDWLDGSAPAFGMKAIPDWPHAYWIGDAFASVHPAIGYGFAHSVMSALLAAKYYLKQDPYGYHDNMKRMMRSKRMMALGMHHLLQQPMLCSALSLVLEKNTWISHGLLTILDY